MSALNIQNLSCSYQKTAVLTGLNLTLKDNEIVCLLGESGCGKTTLLRAVAGLQAELSGHISIQQKVLNDPHTNMPPELRKIGLIFQDYALFPHLNVFDNVAFSLASKMPKSEKQQRVAEVLSLVQLSEMGKRFPHQLSGGQQQRIAIARALAYQPDLMLLDEPFSNLDQHVRFQLIHEIRHLFKQRQMSALFVTHSKEEGFAFADRIALMKAGKIVQIDTAQQLYRAPNSIYVADFMGQTNYIDLSIIDDYSYQSCFGVLNTHNKIEQSKTVKLRLLLRPEHIDITPDMQGEAVVKQVDFQGPSQQITAQFAGQEFLIKYSNHTCDSVFFKVGDKVSLSLLNHDFVVFED
ncbi:ABC transporter ATP-binding protein [Psychromonas sp. B3M02]|uniref:ABC transporter ATP-binding protein n=1 Tax=Psychromonas sp. B3M02 TaxID=2267226 RepID=UPI000DEA2C2A|nr:ABC transporter ATP-binding protein [Psychromonas sp. B3M02]RBW47417.1 ABC transporter ATP-binding protein [Psychromonas sp. B3M02]